MSVKLETVNYDTEVEVPPEVIHAAMTISSWAKKNGISTYEIQDICSRNHATKLNAIKRVLQ